jgi:FkbM family methyltransferase
MLYSFIEIGTSCFETLIEKADDNTVGLSVEPIAAYLNKLPNRKNVTKVNCAVSGSNKFELLSLYYVPEETITQHGLPHWLRGCNSIGAYHTQHELLKIKHLVAVETVPCVTIGHLWEAYNVQAVEQLKIDTEGMDAKIMLQLWHYITSHGKRCQWPKECRFESNELVPDYEVAEVLQRYQAVGYKIVHSEYDTILRLS